MMSDYVKQLEAQNEELQQKLSESQVENDNYSAELNVYKPYWVVHKDFSGPSLSGADDPPPVFDDYYSYECDMFVFASVFFDKERRLWIIECEKIPRDNEGFVTAKEAMDAVVKMFEFRLDNIIASKRRALTGEAQWTT
jgi:hypothetical protein